MPPSARSSRSPRRETDPFGFVARRDAALTDWGERPTPARAYGFALATGYCLVSGTGGPLPMLPVPVTVLACHELAPLLIRWREEATALGDGDGPRLAGLLEARTDTWAVMEAIRQTEADLRDAGDRDALLVTRAFEPLFELLDGFDAALERDAPLVRKFGQSDRATELREMLSPRFRRSPPWWLEG